MNKKPSKLRKPNGAKPIVVRSGQIKVFLGDEEIADNDIKALMLIALAMRISTPRMRVANLDFVLSSKKYGLKVVSGF